MEQFLTVRGNFMRRKTIYIIIGIVLFLTAINSETRVSYDFMMPRENFVLFSLLVITFITSITLTIIDLIHKTRYKTIHIIIFLSIVSGLVFGNLLCNYQTSKTRANFHQVVKALKQYKMDNQQYPETINQLTPKYLPVLPVSRCGLESLSYDYEIINKRNDSIVDIELSIYDRKSVSFLTYWSDENKTQFDDRRLFH